MTKLDTGVGFAIGLGAAISISTAALAPNFVGASLGFLGGITGGACLVCDSSRQKRDERETGVRVTSCFAALYESNRGIIDPTQLAFVANVSVDKAHSFLAALAEQNGGEKVPVKTGAGVLFAFPHAQSALDELTQNAKKWAEAQTQQLAVQLDEHKRAIQYLQLQQKAAAVSVQKTTPKQEVSPWETVNPPV